MSHKAVFAAAILAVVSGPAFAQAFSGGQLGIEYNAPTDGGDFGGTTYSGGMEYSINQNFAVGLNASNYRYDNVTTDANNITLHGMYHLSDLATVGAFYGRDNLNGADFDTYGIEGGMDLAGADVGGYLGMAKDGTDSATLFGLDGQYGFGNGFSAFGGVDLLRDGDVTLSQTTLGAQYDLANGPQFYAQIGQSNISDNTVSANETFVGIGARVAFGAKRGTTFESRSTLEALPGF